MEVKGHRSGQMLQKLLLIFWSSNASRQSTSCHLGNI